MICAQTVRSCLDFDFGGYMIKNKRSKKLLAVCIPLVAVIICAAVFLPWLSDSDGVSEAEFNTVVGKFTDREINSVDSAILAVCDVAEELGLSNATAELSEKSVTTVDGITYYRLQQNYKGIPVYGGAFVVIADGSGEAKGLSGNVSDVNEDISITPTVTLEQVEASIRAYVGDGVEVEIPQLSDEFLVIYGLDKTQSERLAYSLCVRYEELSEFIIDANTAEIISVDPTLVQDVGNYDGLREFPVSREEDEEKSYFLYDEERRIMIGSLDGKNAKKIKYLSDVVSIKSAFSDFSDDPRDDRYDYNEATVLYCSLINIYDYFDLNFGTGNPYSQMIAGLYDDGFYNGNNALGGRWSENVGLVSMGANYGVNRLDTVAHEYTHALSHYYVGWSSQNKETGAIDEGYSDIFGELVEGYVNGTVPNWVHGRRIISDPSQNNYPESISDRNRSGEDYSHGFSTVISYAAYLMTQNGGLTVDELAALWYHTMFTLPANCDYRILRTNMEMVAKTLGFSVEKQGRVSSAFDAVGISEGASEEKYTVDPTLRVYGADLELYGNYTVTVKGTVSSGWGPFKSVECYDKVFSADGAKEIRLELGEGGYVIKITDDLRPTNSFYKRIEIIDSSKYDGEIVIATDFGEAHRHAYVETQKAATCTEAGWKKQTCSCGDVIEEKFDILPHNFLSWKCTTCGKLNLPDGTLQYNGHYYYIFEMSDVDSWDKAVDYCEKMGGHMATISSKAENDVLYAYTVNSGYTSAYFGLSDAVEEGVWDWCNGEVNCFSNWNADEPNDEGGVEDYGMFYYRYTDGTWNDGAFGEPTVNGGTAFICEWEDIYSPENYLPVATKTYNGHTYVLYDVSLTWHDAMVLCQRMGGHLVTITSEEEEAVVEQLIGHGNKKQYWIGLLTTLGWITGEDTVYENWDVGQPDCMNRDDGEHEIYGQIYKEKNPATDGGEALKWNDIFYDNCIEDEADFFSTVYIGFILELEPTE